eukprot:c6246_g2_i1.p1 GENE.c6246_g2_i1~~c6246_g2_i1.p1  ORF type:complete len:456 (-),score=59.97 c6246_g2_i1:13-1338(-)
MTSRVGSLSALVEIEDIRFPILQYLPFEALYSLSATCTTFRQVVREHWVDRCRRASPEEFELAKIGCFGKLPLTKLCRSLVISRDCPLSFENEMPMPAPTLHVSDVHATMEGFIGDRRVLHITNVQFHGSEFTFKASRALVISDTSDLRLVVKVHSGTCNDLLLDTNVTNQVVESSNITHTFLGQPIPAASRFRVRAEASLVTTTTKTHQDKLVRAVLRFVNTDCQTKVIIQDQEDILRILSVQLRSARQSRALVRDQRASLNQVMFLIELGSENTTWCAQPAVIGPMGLCVIPDSPCLSAQARRPYVDINAQVHVKVLMIRKSDGFMKTIMFTKVGSFDILSVNDEQVLVLFKAQSEHPLKLEKFNIEKGGVLCGNCSVIHKYFACLNVVCAVKGHSRHGRYRIHPQDFVMYFEARAMACAHPVEKRVDFEEILMRLLMS